MHFTAGYTGLGEVASIHAAGKQNEFGQIGLNLIPFQTCAEVSLYSEVLITAYMSLPQTCRLPLNI